MTFSDYLGHVESVAFSPDGRHVLSSSYEMIKLWDTATGCQIRTFSGHLGDVTSVAFSPDGRHVLSGCANGIIKLWDISTGYEIRAFSGHLRLVTSVAFSPDGTQILSGSWDQTIRLWNAGTGEEIAQFIGFTDGEWVVITPDGYCNVSPNGDKHLNVRVGNDVHGMDRYREIFHRPDIIASRLQICGRSEL